MNTFVVLSLLLKVAMSIPDADDKLHIYALPVGQGDCTVIQCPRANGGLAKGFVTIIDAGSSTQNRGINGQHIVNFLGGTRLNFVVITHSDDDHLNYMNDILNFYQQDVIVYHPCSWQSYSKIDTVHANPKQVHSCYSIANCKNQVPELNLCPHDDSIKLSFVASAFGGCKNNRANNEDSLIAKITYAGWSTLITGDFEASQGAMRTFLSTARPDLRSDIYRLSHHGAYNGKANQKEFLDAIGAKIVFSSSGYRYKHPRCEVYDYYDAILYNSVNEHPYTCFTSSNNDNIRNVNTRKAIYVTSLYRRNDNNNWVSSYYLFEFSIMNNGNAFINFDHIGDD